MTVTEFRRKKVEVAYFTADQRCVRESFPFSALVGEGPASDGRPTEDRVARA